MILDVDFQSSVIYFFNFSFKDPVHMSLIFLPIVKMSFTFLSQQFKDSKKYVYALLIQRYRAHVESRANILKLKLLRPGQGPGLNLAF